MPSLLSAFRSLAARLYRPLATTAFYLVTFGWFVYAVYRAQAPAQAAPFEDLLLLVPVSMLVAFAFLPVFFGPAPRRAFRPDHPRFVLLCLTLLGIVYLLAKPETPSSSTIHDSPSGYHLPRSLPLPPLTGPSASLDPRGVAPPSGSSPPRPPASPDTSAAHR